jgi:hypothetical protein
MANSRLEGGPLDSQGREASLLVGYRQYRVLIVNDKDRDNLGRLCLARVRTDAMMVIG